MTFDDYQRRAMSTAIYPGRGTGNFSYPALGLAGETGEVCEKVKKILRDKSGKPDTAAREALLREAGDVLWYLAALCSELDSSLGQIAQENLLKVERRQQEGCLHGSGDDR